MSRFFYHIYNVPICQRLLNAAFSDASVYCTFHLDHWVLVWHAPLSFFPASHHSEASRGRHVGQFKEVKRKAAAAAAANERV